MKPSRTKLLIVVLALAALALAVPQAAQAAGTIAGTSITNTVTVNYQIGGTPGAPATATSTFTVDVKVNMTVATTDGTFVASAPSSTRLLTFVVTNTSNTVLDFRLTSIQTATNPFNGAGNDFTLANDPGVAFVDVNANGVYDAGDLTYINELATDATFTVYISGVIPGTATNGQKTAYALIAEARAGGGAGEGAALGALYNGLNVVLADVANATVTGDGSRDAKMSARSGYIVAAISVAKIATVYWDPVNLSVGTQRAIPGAIITYQVTITNPGSVNATNVSISDNLFGQPVTFRTTFDDGTACPADSGIYIVGDATPCKTNTNGDADNADFTGTTVSVTNQTVNALGGTKVIRYQVTVN